jgi:hypothetical protein
VTEAMRTRSQTQTGVACALAKRRGAVKDGSGLQVKFSAI